MNLKKILFISPTGTLDNGAEISIFHLMKFLKFKGYEIFNVVPQVYNKKQIEYHDQYKKAGIKTFFIPVLKWWWEDAPGGQPGSIEERNLYYRENICEIRDIIKKNEIDLVITNTVNMFQGAFAASAEGIPHYWLLHEFPKGEFGYYRDRIDFLEEYSEKIFCVTGELKAYLAPIFSKEVDTFAPYTQVSDQKLKEAKKIRFVSVGRVTDNKNQLELIKAFKIADVKDSELIFIGSWDSTYKKQCLEYIDTHHLKNIKFLGGLNDPWKMVTNKDICIFPSKLETYGLVYVEAILNGVPTIFSNNPGHLSVYNFFDFGHPYKLGNIEELAQKMKYMLENFVEEKNKSISIMPKARKEYQIQNVYKEIINSIESQDEISLNPIRHVANLYSTNEKKSRIARVEKKIRVFYNKAKNRVFPI
ncbi:glycosyltransferase family 4 protein [Enterococcus sp. DIV0756]|uniref:glycosyltransferase family 4 protein n=1 Tax=Enterococcus sp. DIV0756 TaxID=2774636 RepID=UPI003F2753CE